MESTEYFRQQARECRSEASKTSDSYDKRALLQLARHYDAQVDRGEGRPLFGWS
jgi:hypothetical protein